MRANWTRIRSVATSFTLVHDVSRDNGMEAKNVLMKEAFFRGLLFNMVKCGKVIRSRRARDSTGMTPALASIALTCSSVSGLPSIAVEE